MKTTSAHDAFLMLAIVTGLLALLAIWTDGGVVAVSTLTTVSGVALITSILKLKR